MVRRVVVCVRAAASAAARPPRRTSQTDPLQCWWRTSAGAVRVGEPFTVVLTCAVLETDAATVVVDQSRLEPSVVQFAPFEVLGGSHGADLRTRPAPLLPVRVPAAADRREPVRQGRRAAGNQAQLPRAEQASDRRRRCRGAIRPTCCRRSRSACCRWCRPTPPTSATRSAETFSDIDQRAFRANLFTVIGGVLFVARRAAGAARAGPAVRALPQADRRERAADRRRRDPARRRPRARRPCSATRERRLDAGAGRPRAGGAADRRDLRRRPAASARCRRAGCSADGDETAGAGRLILRPAGRAASASRSPAPSRRRPSAASSRGRATPTRAAPRCSSRCRRRWPRFTAAQFGRDGEAGRRGARRGARDRRSRLLRRMKFEQTLVHEAARGPPRRHASWTTARGPDNPGPGGRPGRDHRVAQHARRGPAVHAPRRRDPRDGRADRPVRSTVLVVRALTRTQGRAHAGGAAGGARLERRHRGPSLVRHGALLLFLAGAAVLRARARRSVLVADARGVSVSPAAASR